MASVPFPQAQAQQPQQSKADQIVWRFLNKTVLVLANARITSDSQDDTVTSPSTAGTQGTAAGGRGTSLSNDLDDGGGTPTGSISVAPLSATSPTAGSSQPATTGRARQGGPRVDKWFNLEIPDIDGFKPTLVIYKTISSTFPIAPTDSAIDPPPLIVQVLLSIPQPVNKVLVLTHASTPHRTRIDPTPRYILLESWRVDISRPAKDPRASTSTNSLSTSGSAASGYNVELPTVYKQSIALFRSMHTLLLALPSWKLHRRLRRHGRPAGMSIELRVEVAPQPSLSSSSSASGVEDLPPVYEGAPIIGFDTPLSQHPSANKIESHTFPPVPSPLGELCLSARYRTATNFTLESLESLLSSGFFSADQQQRPSPIELFVTNPPPNYPRPPYPAVSRAPTREEEERDRLLRGVSPLSSPEPRRGPDYFTQEEDREFDIMGADFTPTVVAEQQRRRKESARGAGAAAIPYGSPTGRLGPARQSLSPRSQPGSLPRESFGSAEKSPNGSTYGIPGAGANGLQPPRSRFNSIPHSSSPLNNNSPAALRYPQQSLPFTPGTPIITTPTQRQQLQPLEAPPMHSRTISMPSSAARPVTGGGNVISSPGRFAFAARQEDLPFASPTSGAGGGGFIRRNRKESNTNITSALSSTSSAGGASALIGGAGGPASPTRGGPFTYSPRSRPSPLPTPAPFPNTRKDQVTPPTGTAPLPTALADGPRRPSLNTIHPFKSSTLSSSPGSFGGRVGSPLGAGPSAAGGGAVVGSFGSTRQLAAVVAGGTGLSPTPRSPIGAKHPTGTNESPPNPSLNPSQHPSPNLVSKRLSGSSVASSSRRLSGYSPDLGGAGTPGVPPKRVSTSFSHRYADGGGAGSVRAVPIAGGGATRMSGGTGDTLGLAGVRGDHMYATGSASGSGPTDDDDIQALVRAIDSRPQLRGGTPPTSSRLSTGSPASNVSTSSLPRVPIDTSTDTPPAPPPIRTAADVLTRIREDSSSTTASEPSPTASTTDSRLAGVPGTKQDYDVEMSRRMAEFEKSLGHARQRSTSMHKPPTASPSSRLVPEGQGSRR